MPLRPAFARPDEPPHDGRTNRKEPGRIGVWTGDRSWHGRCESWPRAQPKVLKVIIATVVLGIASIASQPRPEACVAPPPVQVLQVTPSMGLTPGDRIDLTGVDFATLSNDARLYFDTRIGGPGFGTSSPIWVHSDTSAHAFVPNEAETGKLFIKQWVRYHPGCPGGGGPGIPTNGLSVLHLLADAPTVEIDNQRPSAPYGVEATPISGNQIVVRWRAPNIPTLPARDGFVVRISDDFATTWQTAQTIYDPNSQELTVGGLSPATVYAFEVAAFGPTGETMSLPDDFAWATTFGNVSGTAQILASTAANTPPLICNQSPTIRHVEAFFDQPPASGGAPDGIVNGRPGSETAGSYPAYFHYVRDPNQPLSAPIRRIDASASYGRNAAGTVAGNLVVTAYICGAHMPQFVSLHLFVSKPPSGVQVTVVRFDAGDHQQYVPERSASGVIMEGYAFDGTIDTNALTRDQPRAIGNGSGTVTFSDVGTGEIWSAAIQFTFDTPIVRR